MTFNALMLPTLPPTPAAGLKASNNFGSATAKSSRPGESADGNRSFVATLNRVSHRQYPDHSKSTCTEHAASVAVDSGKVTPDCGKTRNTTVDLPEDQAEEAGKTAPAEVTPIPDPRQKFGMIYLRLFDFLMAGDGSSSNEIPSETAGESGLVLLDNPMGYLRPQARGSLRDWLTGIGPFEQLQANIAPEADNRILLELLAAGAAINQSTGQSAGGMTGARAEFMGLWHWLTSALESNLDKPSANVWVNGDTSFAALLHMQQGVADTSGLNADAVGTAGQDAAASLETIKLNEDLLVKMTIPSLPGESDSTENAKLAENAKMAAAGKDASIPLWMTVDPNSEKALETPARQVAENLQLFKMAADARPAPEQSANPNIVTGGAAAPAADHDSGTKGAVLKAESLPITEFGGKIHQIEGDHRDSSFFFAQDQMPGHLKTLESATPTLAGARNGLASQAMDQIVHKAVLLLNNDQHEVHLELKPEFLGHIRMQIVTESQHVAIKITAEMPFVKDMLESNLNQLKAELQAQGLKIDSLEVSVGHDAYAEGDSHQADEIAKVQAVGNGLDFDESWSEKPTQSRTRDNDLLAETAIDYFA